MVVVHQIQLMSLLSPIQISNDDQIRILDILVEDVDHGSFVLLSLPKMKICS